MNDIKEKLPVTLVDELEKALQTVTYGSIEIFVQDSVVTQITVRNIKKTSVGISKISKKNEKFNSHSQFGGKSSVRIKIRS